MKRESAIFDPEALTASTDNIPRLSSLAFSFSKDAKKEALKAQKARMKGIKGDGYEEKRGNPTRVMHCRETNVTWSRVVVKREWTIILSKLCQI